MSLPFVEWTDRVDIAGLRADPSGVQAAGTAAQLLLLPGMSTQTPNVRYISLFTAGQYWRHCASEEGQTPQSFNEFFRRFEGLVAIASVLHHDAEEDVPFGVVGRTHADEVASQTEIKLEAGVVNPAYSIYRGTLGNLGLFDLAKRGDPLYSGAKELGAAWEVNRAGELGMQIQHGEVPGFAKHDELIQACGAFCLCEVPLGTEREALTRLLFGFGSGAQMPDVGLLTPSRSVRMGSWRMLLDVVERSEGSRISAQHMMARLLEPDIVAGAPSETIRRLLYGWRWVAARAIFERGWTVAFNEALRLIKSSWTGLSPLALTQALNELFFEETGRRSIGELWDQAVSNFESGAWLEAQFSSNDRDDLIMAMMAGLEISKQDMEAMPLASVAEWDQGSAIPLAQERENLRKAVNGNVHAADYWADVGSRSLINHVQIALQKMRAGNPDTLHVEYERGTWIVPPDRMKWTPQLSVATSRLDIALGWLGQLGIAEHEGEGKWKLTPNGHLISNQWDEEFSDWP